MQFMILFIVMEFEVGRIGAAYRLRRAEWEVENRRVDL